MLTALRKFGRSKARTLCAQNLDLTRKAFEYGEYNATALYRLIDVARGDFCALYSGCIEVVVKAVYPALFERVRRYLSPQSFDEDMVGSLLACKKWEKLLGF